jgi:hypothetical protein
MEENMKSFSGSEQPLAASANCSATPSAPANVAVGTNVKLTGSHSYSVSNPDTEIINVTIVVALQDSEGNNSNNSQPLTVQPGTTTTGTMDTFLVASYDHAGDVMVTAKTDVTGDVFCSSSSGTRMKVG